MHSGDGISGLVKCVGKWSADESAAKCCIPALGALKSLVLTCALTSLDRAELQSLSELGRVRDPTVANAIQVQQCVPACGREWPYATAYNRV